MAESWSVPALNNQTTGHLTTAAELNQFGNSLRFLVEVAYVEFTSTVSVTATSNVQVVSAGAITFEAVPHLVEFYCPRVIVGGSGTFDFNLRDVTTEIQLLADFATSASESAVYIMHRLVPTAASHTYNISGQNGTSQTTSVAAGAGGDSVRCPGWIRITRAPT